MDDPRGMLKERLMGLQMGKRWENLLGQAKEH